MQQTQHTRNKLIVLARKIYDITQDPDFSFRKLAETFGKQGSTVHEINNRFKDRYDFGVAFKVDKKGK